MKKILLGLLLIIPLCFNLFACSSSGATYSLKWQNLTGEVITYSVNYEADATEKNPPATLVVDNSSYYKTEMTNQNGTTFVKTTLIVNGSYTFNGATTPFTDMVYSEVEFSTAVYCTPISSKKISATTTIMEDGNKYKLQTNYYQSSISYSGKNANIELKTFSEPFFDSAFNVNSAIEPTSVTNKTLKKLSTPFYDNDMYLSYGIRAMNLKNNFSNSVRVVSPIDKASFKMNISSGKRATSDITFSNFQGPDDLMPGDKMINCFTVSTSISSVMSGASIVASYANINGLNSILCQVKNTLPYGMGTLTYNVTAYSFS